MPTRIRDGQPGGQADGRQGIKRLCPGRRHENLMAKGLQHGRRGDRNHWVIVDEKNVA
jgi:hypothetical protein